MGRVTLNPIAHIDVFGTLILPALRLLLKAPFLFGYAKPVPGHFSRLNHPRRDMALVAIAGPASNVPLSILAALLFRAVHLVPARADARLVDNRRTRLLPNLVLTVFNMLPIPPLDCSRILGTMLPEPRA